MPVVQSLMDNLQRRYGEKEGERIYYAMEAEGKGPFAEGGKYRHLHEQQAARAGVTPSQGKKKPPTKKAGGKRQRR